VNRLPLLLTALRAALAPLVVLLALVAPLEPAFALCLTVALVSDIFDGVLARRLGVATPGLRRLDSVADSLFYLAATFAVWHLAPAVIARRWAPLLILAALELARYAVDWVKFRREAAYHMWSSKAWGLALFCAFMSVLAFGVDGLLVDAAIGIGIAADLEGLAISLALTRWHNDVPSLVHALRLRKVDRG